jgi:hypothetical protein
MDAAVLVDPIEYQRHPGEPSNPSKLLRTRRTLRSASRGSRYVPGLPSRGPCARRQSPMARRVKREPPQAKGDYMPKAWPVAPNLRRWANPCSADRTAGPAPQGSWHQPSTSQSQRQGAGAIRSCSFARVGAASGCCRSSRIVRACCHRSRVASWCPFAWWVSPRWMRVMARK